MHKNLIPQVRGWAVATEPVLNVWRADPDGVCHVEGSWGRLGRQGRLPGIGALSWASLASVSMAGHRRLRPRIHVDFPVILYEV